jgi:GAF domain-containing protein/two-component sensor histidine kinase
VPWGRYDEPESDIAGGPQIENGRTIGVLRRQLEAALAERDEARAQQVALAEALQAINAANGDFAPVFDVIIGKAMALCDAPFGSLLGYENQQLTMLAERNSPSRLIEYWSSPQPVAPESATARVLREGNTSQIADLSQIDSYLKHRLPMTVVSVELGNIRTLVQVPLVGERGTIGLFILYRQEVRPFTEAQIALVESFAAQATLAMENARRFAEQRESLEQQTAISEVLEVINGSPGDLEPVFGAMLEKAMHLCEAAFGIFGRFDGKLFEPVVDRDVPPELIATTRQIQSPPPNSGLGRLAAGESVVQLVNIANTDVYRAGFVGATALVDIGGARTAIFVALRKEGVLLGVIVMYRREVRAFSDKQVALLQSFAAQAVIAMENARLLTEQREALEQQTATADILRVISQSPTDVQPVLDAVADSARLLCASDHVHVHMKDGNELVTRASASALQAAGTLTELRIPIDRRSAAGRAVLEGRTVHLPNVMSLDATEHGKAQELAKVGGFGTLLSAPMIRDGAAVGVITLPKMAVEPFTPRQIALLETFAAQAVIAIENVRLFTELKESLDQQTATADILRVINASQGDVTPVFQAILEKAHSVCRADMGSLFLRDGDNIRAVTTMGYDEEIDAILRQSRPPMPAMVALMEGQRFHHLADLKDDTSGSAQAFGPQFRSGSRIRTNLIIPLRKDSTVLGFISANRREVRPYSDKEIGLIESFATQAVIAMENARLLGELREALEQQTATSDILRVISQSPTDVQPVLDAVAKAAVRLCEGADTVIVLREGDHWFAVAHEGPLASPSIRLHRKLTRETAPGRAIFDRSTVHFPDIQTLDPVEFATEREISQRLNFRATVSVPMLRDGESVGTINLRKNEPGPFSPRHVALLESFAAQAVIALENTRLFTELRESLDQQTATSDILRVISQSPTDVQPVLNVVVKAAQRFCGAEDVVISLRDGDTLAIAAHDGPIEAPPPRRKLDRSTTQGRAVIDVKTIHLPDIAQVDPAEWSTLVALSQRFGAKASLAAPMLREGMAVGAIMLRRREAGPFTERQMALLEAFAAQAVIAIENVRLFTELQKRTDDLAESLDYQTATSEVLSVISRSPADLQPVLEAMTAAAVRLCGVKTGGLSVRRGDTLQFVALVGQTPEFEQWQMSAPLPIERGILIADAVLDKEPVQVVDVMETDAYKAGAEVERAVVELGGHRTILHVPLLRDDEAVGVLTVSRSEPEAFTERQIGLIKTFADQAVIAMENARLLSELRERTDDLTESLEYQTATSEVLEVISRSTDDIHPVLDKLVALGLRLGEADHCGIVVRGEDGRFRFRALAGPAAQTVMESGFLEREMKPGHDTIAGRALLEKRVVHVEDVHAIPGYSIPEVMAYIHTALAVPLMRDGEPVGVINITRSRVELFTDRQVALIKTFADQAVIAMENARLLGELTRREEELRVTFDHMGDGVAMFDAGLKLASWNRNFQELLDIPDSFLATRPGLEDYVRLLVQRGEVGSDNPEEEIARYRDRVNEAWTAERTRPDGRVIEVRNNPVPGGGAVLIYSDITERKKAEAAIAAARDEAEAALERQTATADILKVIASSPTDVRPVLDVLAKAAVRFCGATDAAIHMRDGNDSMVVAHEGPLPLGPTQSSPTPLNRETGFGMAILDCVTIHRPDVQALDPIKFAAAHAFARELGFRAVLVVPLRRDGTAIGAISLRRAQVGAFSPQQIELLETFAAQAVIAIENVRLFTELRDSLERLKAAQANLVQSEKMASLGQLTAGIAHEIKNPLNFVNNFATLSVDLLDELKQVAGPALATLDGDARAEVDETMELLVGNLGKIAEHGKRADGIVKSMLSHSRGGTGDWAPADINALVEEALNLAYHGARASDKEFNVTLERDLEKTGTPIEVVPQDVTRVFLNLFGNGFYAANKRRLGAKQPGFRPTLKVTTRDLGDTVEVKVRDNGIGMPPEVKEKLFQPFFTTKPTGEGTGLGLSISYDIVTQQHGGTIDVESEPNNYTEFTVRLPRARRVAEASRGA